MYIVTGGAGFIGTNIIRGLNQRGIDEILVVDELDQADKHLGLSGLDFHDFVDHRDLAGHWDQVIDDSVEAVLHQGACSDTMESDGRYMMQVNYECSKELLHCCLDEEVPFLYASSAAVYGNGDAGFREEPACESPLNVYAFSKFQFDRYVRRVATGAPSQVAGLRYFNVYGPQENHKGRMASVVYHFHNQIQDGGSMRVFEGSEGFLRDFVFVDDVVDVNLWLLENPEVSGVFNCGTGTARSFLDIANCMRELYGDATAIETIPFPDALEGKYQAYTCADLASLRAAGFEAAFTSLEDGIGSYVERLRATGGYYRPEAQEAQGA